MNKPIQIPNEDITEFLTKLQLVYEYSQYPSEDHLRKSIDDLADFYFNVKQKPNARSNPINPSNTKKFGFDELNFIIENDASGRVAKEVSTDINILLHSWNDSSTRNLKKALNALQEENIDNFGMKLQERLLDQETDNFLISNLSENSINDLEFINTLKEAFEKEDASVRAEIMSVIVTYSGGAMSEDIKRGVIPLPPSPEDILNRISELSFTVSGSKPSRVEPMIYKLTKAGSWNVSKAGSGIVDSIYKDPYTNRLTGTSTTLDISGEVEKDQLSRHPYKVYRINQLLIDSGDIKKPLSQFSNDTKMAIVDVQKWDSSKTYNEMKLESQNDFEGNGGNITEGLVESMYSSVINMDGIDYTLDLFGDLLNVNDTPLTKVIKVKAFLDYQKRQADDKFYTSAAKKVMYTNIKTRVKRLSQYHKMDFDIKLDNDLYDFVINITNDFLQSDGYKAFNSVGVTSKDKTNTIFQKIGNQIDNLLDNNFNKAKQLYNQIRSLMYDASEVKGFKSKDPTVQEINHEIISIIKTFLLASSNEKIFGIIALKASDNGKLGDTFTKVVSGKPEYAHQLDYINMTPDHKQILGLQVGVNFDKFKNLIMNMFDDLKDYQMFKPTLALNDFEESIEFLISENKIFILEDIIRQEANELNYANDITPKFIDPFDSKRFKNTLESSTSDNSDVSFVNLLIDTHKKCMPNAGGIKTNNPVKHTHGNDY